MSMIKVKPIYGNGWFGPIEPGHIDVPPPFEAEDISSRGGRTLSIISSGSVFSGMIMERSQSFSGSAEDYVPYNVSLFPAACLVDGNLKSDAFPDYQGYVLIEEGETVTVT